MNSRSRSIKMIRKVIDLVPNLAISLYDHETKFLLHIFFLNKVKTFVHLGSIRNFSLKSGTLWKKKKNKKTERKILFGKAIFLDGQALGIWAQAQKGSDKLASYPSSLRLVLL